MDKETILNEFDHLSKAKKQNSLALKLSLIFAFIVVVAVLVWGFLVSQTALNKVVVISKSGEYLETEVASSEALFNARVQSTCDYATSYANSFDRQSIKKNQAKAFFYINKNDLNAIFQKYYNDRAYNDATNAGAVYQCNLEKVSQISGDNEPYRIAFSSILTVYSGGKTFKFRLRSEGELISTSPRYPENVTGFMFSRLTQQVENISTEELETTQDDGQGN